MGLKKDEYSNRVNKKKLTAEMMDSAGDEEDTPISTKTSFFYRHSSVIITGHKSSDIELNQIQSIKPGPE